MFDTMLSLLLLVLCTIPNGRSMDSADIQVDGVSIDSQIVSPLGSEDARQDPGATVERVRFHDPNLHPDHYRFYFNRRPDEARACRLDPSCPYKDQLDTSSCWGYEKGCTIENMSGYPKMEKRAEAWVSSEEEQLKMFWDDADFGYVKRKLDEGWHPICTPKIQNGSSLSCTNNLNACKAKHFLLDLTNLGLPSTYRGRLDVDYFETPGQVGGHCNVDKALLKKHSSQFASLQSWYGELREYTSLNVDPFETSGCDVIIEGRSYLMKMDAGINMFHHFCDFVNLYITRHIMNDFSLNVTIVMWDMSNMMYMDPFQETWAAFSDRPVARLSDWSGKKVCFRDAVFTLPPRMIRGFFYNMPMVPHTYHSSLMHSFSNHILHRLGIRQKKPVNTGKVRVTILDRKSAHRNIINQEELVHALQQDPSYEVKVVVYNHSLTFLQQMEITHNSDIFIGMHGAGLTHLLFLPDWAAIFELCNCEDKHCYQDLASLRGVRYITWENVNLLKKHNEILHPSLKKYHPKFCDYSFDKVEFLRLVKKAQHHVENHPKFKERVAAHDEL